jgi:hypothetical protein
MANRVAETILKYTVDQASVAASKRAIADLKGEQQQLSTALGGFGAGTQAGVNAVRTRFKYLRDDVRTATSDIEKLRTELERVNSTAATGARTSNVSSSVVSAAATTARAGTNSLSRIGQNLYAMPSIPIPGTGLTTDMLGKVARSLGGVGVTLGQLGTVAAIAAPAVVLAAVAMDNLNKQLEGTQKTARALIATQKEYYTLIGTATSDQLDAAIAQKEREVEAARAAFAELDYIVTQGYAEARQIGGGLFASLIGGVAEVTNAGGTRELREARDKAEQELFNEEYALGRLTNARTAGATAANDMAEYERQLADARTKAILMGADRARENIAQEAEFSRLSSQQIQERIRRYQEDNAAFEAGMAGLISPFGATLDDISRDISRFVREGQDSEQALRTALVAGDIPTDIIDKIVEYRRQLDENKEDINSLLATYYPLAVQREREAEAMRDIVSAIDDRITADQRAAELMREGTADQIDTRVTALNDERAAIMRNMPALKAQAEASDEGADALNRYTARLAEINGELAQLEGIRPKVALRQFREETEALSQSLRDDVAKIRTDRDAKIADIRADLAAKELEAERTRAEALTEARDKAQAEREDQEAQHQDNLRRIITRANSTIANAVANRDALAAFMAQQQRDEELEEEQKANAKRVKEIQKREGEQLKVIEKRYSDQLRTAQQAAQRAITLEVQKAQAEIALRGQAYNAELQQLQSALFAQYGLQNQFWAATYNLAARTVASISGIQVQAARTTQLANLYTQPNIKKYASGGYPPVGSTVLVGENGPELARFMSPARVYSNEQSRAMAGGGMTINIPVTAGMSANQIVQTVDARLYDTLKKAGVPD